MERGINVVALVISVAAITAAAVATARSVSKPVRETASLAMHWP